MYDTEAKHLCSPNYSQDFFDLDSPSTAITQDILVAENRKSRIYLALSAVYHLPRAKLINRQVNYSRSERVRCVIG